MLYSRVQLLQCTQPVNASVSRQDTYDVQDDVDDEDDDRRSHDASVDNFYDALAERDPGAVASLSDIRINMDPTDRLIDAIEMLREVIVDNTNAQQRSKRRPGAGQQGTRAGVTAPIYRANGSAINLKEEKLKIRKEKLLQDPVFALDHIAPATRRRLEGQTQ
ncbi:hypothetical protein LSH36_366g04032 [Paralvinella palmiformis]|uniref:Uncharacterized protein n=1 Tax=Paralvinella palmiformis TaxID=53620 RepID=A0AAD9N0W8_9ANNE|nr:hypothetical protein LSH36_366g04032 [Paralvinella palmiformis]